MAETTSILFLLIGVFLFFLFLSNSEKSDNRIRNDNVTDASHDHPDIKAGLIEQIAAGDFGDDDSGIILRRNEQLLVHVPMVSYCEERVVGRAGRSAGVSFRAARGLWIRTGGHNSANVEEITELDCGDFIVTTHRLIFIGSSKALDYSLSKIMKIDAADDQIAISRSGKQKIEYFAGVNKLKAVIEAPSADGSNETNKLTFHIESSDLKKVILRVASNHG